MITYCRWIRFVHKSLPTKFWLDALKAYWFSYSLNEDLRIVVFGRFLVVFIICYRTVGRKDEWQNNRRLQYMWGSYGSLIPPLNKKWRFISQLRYIKSKFWEIKSQLWEKKRIETFYLTILTFFSQLWVYILQFWLYNT